MKSFNKVITVEISVDKIAQQLLKMFSADEKHAEQVVETIIGTSLENNKLSYLYNSINGFSNEINFKVNETIVCKATKYTYIDGIEKRVEIGFAKIIDINIYQNDKIRLSYTYTNSKGVVEDRTGWFHHSYCNKIEKKSKEMAQLEQS